MSELWSAVWATVASEFSDIGDAEELTRVTLRLVLAAALGGVLGYERESKGKAAGLRTHMLVALGSALFVLIPERAGAESEDLSRIVQGLVAGIGFLGAGAIIKVVATERTRGLTTAASVWTTAAIGVAAGLGRGTTAVLASVLALVILSRLRALERRHAPPEGDEPSAADKPTQDDD